MRLAFFNLSTQFIAFVILIIIFTNNQIFATAFMDLLSIVSVGQKELIGAVIIIFRYIRCHRCIQRIQESKNLK